MKLGTKQFAIAALTAALAGVSAQASALTLYYQQNSLFTDFVQTDGATWGSRGVYGTGADTLLGSTYTGEIAADADGHSGLEWNHGSTVDSSLNLVTHAGAMSDDNVWQTITTLNHVNNEIDGIFKWDATISSNLQFFSGSPTSNANFIFSDALSGSFSEVAISFWETPNPPYACPTANLAGTQCDDYWTFDNTAIDEIIYYDDGEDLYAIEFRLDTDNPTQVVVETGEVYTGENDTNILRVQMRMHLVPEPGVLALMGLGLVGLSFAARRRKS